MECATDARYLYDLMRKMTHAPVYLDSSTLSDLRQLFDEGIGLSDCVLLLCTSGVLTRPWCLLELLEAKRRGVPVLPVLIVGIADRADQLAGDLSYGHQRLLEIAMGLSQGPRLLILDEPTQGLADSEIADFIALIRNLAGEMTILLIEHNINVVMQTANAITVLNAGQVLAEGTPDAIRANAAVQAAYLGTG